MNKQSEQQVSFDLNKARLEAQVKNRLEYLRKEIETECISYGEIAELQSLVDWIEPNDVLLLEWAGVKEL